MSLHRSSAWPLSWAAAALIVLGLLLLVAEVKVTSHGLLAIGGVISLTLGSLMLFESPDPTLRVSLRVIVPTIATLAGVILFVVQRALQAQTHRVTTGVQGLIGQIAVASTALNPDGQVFVHGELWNATSTHLVKRGEQVRVVRVDGLRLTVKPV